jgi:hypothetical protein
MHMPAPLEAIIAELACWLLADTATLELVPPWPVVWPIPLVVWPMPDVVLPPAPPVPLVSDTKHPVPPLISQTKAPSEQLAKRTRFIAFTSRTKDQEATADQRHAPAHGVSLENRRAYLSLLQALYSALHDPLSAPLMHCCPIVHCV